MGLALIAISSCGPSPADVSKAKTDRAIWSGAQKFWVHRANTVEKAKKALATYPGVELDVVFEDGRFDVRHDIYREAAGLSLDAYFKALKTPSRGYYWIDIKNLRFWNEEKAARRMAEVVKRHGLKDRVIVESKSISGLTLMKRAGLATSYWFPHYKYDPKDLEDARDDARKLAGVLSRHQFNAISCHYRMVPFVRHFFPKLNVHIWTNGLNFKTKRAKIDAFAAHEQIRVVLIDP